MIKSALKSGLIVGLIAVIVAVLVYLMDVTIFVSWWYGLLLVPLITTGVTVYFGIAYRNDEEGGYLKFGSAYGFSYVSLMISSVIGILFGILLFTVIEPGLSEILVEKSLENTEAIMQRFGAPQDAIDEALEDQEESLPKQFTAVGQLKGIIAPIIINAIFALFAGLIIKKKESEPEMR